MNSDQPSFVLSDYYELLALHRALIEAKFHPDPQNLDVPGSPLLACVSNRALETLQAMEIARGCVEASQKWDDWRKRPKDGQSWRYAMNHAAQVSEWSSWSGDEKNRFVVDLLAPYVVDEASKAEFVAEVDRLVEGRVTKP